MTYDNNKIVETMRHGGLALLPTDTIWGLSCIVSAESTVERIYTLKKRPRNQALIILVSSIEMLKEHITLHPRIETLLSYHNKPLTLIYPESVGFPDYLLAKDGSIAIRIVQNPHCQALINALGAAIVSTSANVSGVKTAENFEEIDQVITKGVDIIAPRSWEIDSDATASKIASFDDNGELHFIR